MKEKDNRQEDEKEGGGRRMAKKSRAMRYWNEKGLSWMQDRRERKRQIKKGMESVHDVRINMDFLVWWILEFLKDRDLNLSWDF
jgi:hypothetical protein